MKNRVVEFEEEVIQEEPGWVQALTWMALGALLMEIFMIVIM